jgi:transcriptional regulator with XRE-family HTH domain
MAVGSRIRKAREARGLTQGKLAEAINQAQTTISSWERGRTEPTREDVARVASIIGVPVAELEGAVATSDSVAVVGYVGAGDAAVLYAEGQGELYYVTPPSNRTKDTVAVEIRGVSLGPAFDGGLVFYDDVHSPVTPDQHGRLCVVGLPTGKVLVKILRAAGEGRFHLLSNTTEAPLLDQQVEWAALVKDIRPR